MARPREFDEQQVVSLARDAFWSNGVTATSVSDLSAATGLSVGSIYKAFDSKSALCELTLDDYLVAALALVVETLGGEVSPLGGIEAWLDLMADQAGVDSPTRGCYAVALAIELAATDDAIRDKLTQHDRRLRGVVSDALRTAVTHGELDCDPTAGARLLCTTVNGIQVEARKGISVTDARATLHLALDALR